MSTPEKKMSTLERAIDRKAEVWAACDRVIKKGKKPSLGEVQIEGIKGIQTDIHTYIKEWYQHVFAAHLNRGETSGMPGDVLQIFSSVYKRCCDLAANQFAVERLQLERRGKEAEEMADALRLRNSQLDREVTRLQMDMERLKVDAATTRDALIQADLTIKELFAANAASYQAREADRAAHTKDINQMNSYTEALKRSLDRLERRYQELMAQKVGADDALRTAEGDAELLEQKLGDALQRVDALQAKLEDALQECDRMSAQPKKR